MQNKSYNEILHYLKLDSVFYSRSTFSGHDWGIDLPEFKDTSMFHIVAKGSCELEIDGEIITLTEGDLVFMSDSFGHSIRGLKSKTSLDLFSHPLKRISENFETLDSYDEDDEDRTIILCGVIKLSHPAAAMLIREMPDYIHVKNNEHSLESMMKNIVSLISTEASKELIGGEAVLTRLADVLIIQAIRHWFEELPESEGQWLNAIKDEQIGKALAKIHAMPSEQWTIESLGKEVGMSRTAFSNRFTEVVGDSVLNYLTKWRMNLAAMKIKEGAKIDLEFVESLGYKSDSSFRRAFKKVMGMNISEVKLERAS